MAFRSVYARGEGADFFLAKVTAQRRRSRCPFVWLHAYKPFPGECCVTAFPPLKKGNRGGFSYSTRRSRKTSLTVGRETPNDSDNSITARLRSDKKTAHNIAPGRVVLDRDENARAWRAFSCLNESRNTLLLFRVTCSAAMCSAPNHCKMKLITGVNQGIVISLRKICAFSAVISICCSLLNITVVVANRSNL